MAASSSSPNSCLFFVIIVGGTHFEVGLGMWHLGYGVIVVRLGVGERMIVAHHSWSSHFKFTVLGGGQMNQ